MSLSSVSPSRSETVVFGIHAVSHLLESRPEVVDRLYFLAAPRHAPALFQIVKSCRQARRAYQHVPLARLDELSVGGNHQGVVALCAAKEYEDADALVRKLTAQQEPQLVLVPASVEDPGNLGAIIRSCAAFGVNAVFLETRHTAPLGATVAKTSAGMLELVPIARPRALGRMLEGLRSHGFSVIGAEAGAGCSPDQCNLKGNTVLVMGGENRGIPPYLKKVCDRLVSIPLASRVNSLNVSAAAAILLYECCRQRTTMAE